MEPVDCGNVDASGRAGGGPDGSKIRFPEVAGGGACGGMMRGTGEGGTGAGGRGEAFSG